MALRSLLLAAAILAWALPAQAQGVPKYVFAHYMVCCSRFGHGSTIPQLQQEIRDAEARKIDGFVLDVGSWTQEPYYKQVSERMFAAAAALPTDFKLFFSFDNLPVSDSIAAMVQFAANPRYLKLDGKPVVSTYGETGEWGRELRDQLRAKGIEIVLVPGYNYAASSVEARFAPEGRDTFTAARSLQDNPDIEGYFYFGAGDEYADLAKSIHQIAALVHDQGKIFMAGIAPYYKGFRGNSRVFESDGFRGMQEQWLAAIESGADWAQIVTWNDWGEATYVSPLGAPRREDFWGGNWGPLLAHEKFLEASAYYIDWFKSGRQPDLTADRVYYFYRIHPKDASGVVDPEKGTVGRPWGWENLHDRIYVAAFLTRDVELDVTVGGKSTTVSLPKGVSLAEVPMDLGRIELTARAGGKEIGRKTLELTVGADGTRGNYNYFTGELAVE